MPVQEGRHGLRKKSLNLEELIPQRLLKPDLFATTYVRAEARTLQEPDLSAAAVVMQTLLGLGKTASLEV